MEKIYYKFIRKSLLISLLINICHSQIIKTDCDYLKEIVNLYPKITHNWPDGSMECCDNDKYICDSTNTYITSIDLSLNHLNGPLSKIFGSFSRLESLDLHNNKLTGSIPHEFTKLKKLKKLDLSANEIEGDFPKFITTLTNLETLNLSNNNIHGSLPKELQYLVNLEYFSVRYNYISGSIDNIFNEKQNIKILDLSLNDIEGEIPESIGSIKTLNEIHLNNNNLEGNLPKSLIKLNDLKILYLSDNDDLSGSVPELSKSVTMCSYKNTDLCIHENAHCGKGTKLCTETSEVFKYILIVAATIVATLIVLTLIYSITKKLIARNKTKRVTMKDKKFFNSDDDDIIELNGKSDDKEMIEIENNNEEDNDNDNDEFVFSPELYKKV